MVHSSDESRSARRQPACRPIAYRDGALDEPQRRRTVAEAIGVGMFTAIAVAVNGFIWIIPNVRRNDVRDMLGRPAPFFWETPSACTLITLAGVALLAWSAAREGRRGVWIGVLVGAAIGAAIEAVYLLRTLR
jgi:hypothetical protein